jgi:NDP-sugar pyrophosphorylase family protein
MKAMILAAGEGTRLRPLTLALPKPMVPLANIPLLERTIRLLAAQDVTEIAINLFHRPEAIQATLGDGAAWGVRLHYSHEPTLLGTAGGVKRLEAFFDEPFLVLYGDNLYQADFAPLIAAHRAHHALATLATFEAANPSACGLIVTDDADRITRFQEKPPPAEVFTNRANAGVYILDPEVLRFIPAQGPSDFGKDIFPALLAERPLTLFARPLGGYLQDTGTVSSYRQANWDMIEGRVGRPAEPAIAPSAHVTVGAYLGNRVILGAGVHIESSASITESILWDDVFVGTDARIEGAILGRGVRVGAGAIIGEGAILADGVNVAPGVFVPPDTRVGPGETVG